MDIAKVAHVLFEACPLHFNLQNFTWVIMVRYLNWYNLLISCFTWSIDNSSS